MPEGSAIAVAWIPAYAGMTLRVAWILANAGVTLRAAGMTPAFNAACGG